MICLKICEDSTAQELKPIAEAVHCLLGLPVTIRSLNCPGIRMERGKVLDWEYTGPILEEVLEVRKVVRKVPSEGTYRGKAVVVSPIRTQDGSVVGAIGVVDLVAALDILSVFREYPDIIDEVEAARKRQ
jgi:hypothetical protein